MANDGLTRRTLVAALAGAGAAGLLRPAGTYALSPATPAVGAGAAARLSDRWLGDLAPGTISVSLPVRVDLVGMQWTDPARAAVDLRARVAGSWGAWATASGLGHGPDAPPAGARIGDPIWVGGADRLQLRVRGAVRGVRLHYVDVSAGRGARAVAAAAHGASLRLAQPLLQAGPGQPPIVDREAWALGRCPPAGPPEYGEVGLAFVHHTENPNGYAPAEVPAMLRAIFAFHRYLRGWRDIGYNFVIDSLGRIFEARTGGIDEPVLGAHAGGYNASSTGIAVLGDFVSAPVSAPALASLKRLVAWKLSLHGKPIVGSLVVHVSPSGAVFSRFPARAAVRLPRIAGHRDADSTSCPGDSLYRQLPEIRRAAHVLAGTIVRSTLLAPQTRLLAPGPLALSGTLASLDGSAVAAASIAVQSRRLPGGPPGPREVTVAQATTAADGTWSVSLPAWNDASLRALHVPAAGVPAAVSDPLDISVAPALSLAASPAAPVVGQVVALSGTVAPAKAHVEVDVWRLLPDGRRAGLRRTHLAAVGGAFSTSFAPPLAGTYQCAAASRSDALNAAGRSPVLTLVVTAVPSGATLPPGAPPPAGPAPTNGAPTTG